MNRRLDISIAGCMVIMASIAPAGCDSAIDPISERADLVFAIHGFLDSASDSQFVRVSALRPTILADAPSLEKVSVNSVDVASGGVVFWSDSLVLLDDGSIGHLFHSEWSPIPGHEYRLEVRREDAVAATATTLIPLETDIRTLPATGDTLVYVQDVIFRGLREAPQELVMKYGIGVDGTSDTDEVDIWYGSQGMLGPEGWHFEVYLKRDQQVILQKLGLPSDYRAAVLHSIGVQVTLSSAEWKQQDAPTNLVNAHGFFGSIGRFTLNWSLDREEVGVMGFLDMQSGR